MPEPEICDMSISPDPTFLGGMKVSFTLKYNQPDRSKVMADTNANYADMTGVQRGQPAGGVAVPPATTIGQILQASLEIAGDAEETASKASIIAEVLHGPVPSNAECGNPGEVAEGAYRGILIAHERTRDALKRMQITLDRIQS